MRFDSLQLIKYGKFTDQQLDFPAAKQDFHFIIGPNEAGKSTLRQAIVEALFGIATRSQLNFIHPLPELRLGAGIRHQADTLDFHRTKAASKTLRTPANEVLPDNALQPFLGSADQHFYEQMFGLDHAALIKGGKTILDEKDQLGQMLFQAAAGMADLGKARDQMKAEALKLWAPSKSKEREYYQAQQQLETASAELKELTVRTKDWATLQDNLAKLQQQLLDSRQQQQQLLQQQKRLQRVRRLAPHWHTLKDAEQAQQALQDANPHADQANLLEANARQIFNQAEQQLAQSAPLLELHQAEIKRLEDLLAHHPVDSTLLARAADIEQLSTLQQRVSQHEQDIALREAEMATLWRQIQQACQQLNWPDYDNTDSNDQKIAARLPHLPLRKQLDALARDASGLQKAVLASTQAQAAKQSEIADLQQQMAGPDAREYPANLIQPLQAALNKAASLGDIDSAQHKQQQACKKAQAALDQALLALGPWQKNVNQLHSMLLPDASALAAWGQEQQALQQQDKSQHQRLQDKLEEVAKQQAEINRMQSGLQLTTHQAVLASRAERDTLWHAIQSGSTPLAQGAAAFETQMLQADQLADAHLANVEQANLLQTRQQQLQQAQQEQARLQEASHHASQQLQALAERWANWCHSLALPGLPLDQIHSWLARREQALACAQALAQEQAHSEQLQHSLTSLHAQLQQALASWQTSAPAGAAGLPAADLGTLCHQAQHLIKASEAASVKRSALQQQLHSAQSALQHLERQSQQASAAQAKWQQEWDSACQQAGMPAASSSAVVAGALELCSQIAAALEQRRQIQSERIDTMRADLQRFGQAAQTLASSLATSFVQQAAPTIAQHLQQRLHSARNAEQQNAQWQSELENARQKYRVSQAQQQQAQASLQPLLQRAGVQTPLDLAQAITRSEQVRHWQQQIGEAQAQLLRDGDALNQVQIEAEISSTRIDSLLADLDQLDHDLQQSREQQDQLLKAETEAHMALAKVQGSDSALLAEARRQEALAQMADVAERYIKAFTAVHLLSWAINRYREEKQGPLLARASDLFAALSLHSFERLIVDFEHQPLTLQGRRPDGKLVKIEGMSDGTRDQLYLSLRLAALELHLQNATPLPFIADDLFINFDDARAAAGLAALARLSQQTQVIFLSHHDHLLPMVRAVFGERVNVVRL